MHVGRGVEAGGQQEGSGDGGCGGARVGRRGRGGGRRVQQGVVVRQRRRPEWGEKNCTVCWSFLVSISFHLILSV